MSEPVTGKKLQWTMGEQPNWIGVEQPGELPAGLLEELLKDGVCQSLLKRGYGVVPLTDDVREPSVAMDTAMRAFCRQGEEVKVAFVSLNESGATKGGVSADAAEEKPRHSPNEFHGFARVEGLKEQFMGRIGGPGTELLYPSAYPVDDDQGDSPGFGMACVSLYQLMDQRCRGYLSQVADKLGVTAKKLNFILDPVADSNAAPQRSCAARESASGTETAAGNGGGVVTDYLYGGYISTSLLDVFHYYPRTKDEYAQLADAPTRHLNNHLSHTDSGIMTAVLSSAEPGLEVFDQHLDKWICLEQIIYNHHQASSADPDSGRGVFARYLMVFLGDSCVYLSPKSITPCLHRVSCSRPEHRRFSYVFKMRTRAEATAPRYQEDYIIANIQHKALEAAGVKMSAE